MTEFLNQTIAAMVNSAAPLEVEVMKEAMLEIEVPLFYIHSGKNEIQNYIDDVSKPEINKYVEDYAKPIVDEIVTRDAAQLIDNYVENETKPAIDEYADKKMEPWATAAEEAATVAANSEKAAFNSAASAAATAAVFETTFAESIDEFNSNAAEKQTAVDASAVSAAESAAAAKSSETAAAASAVSASGSAQASAASAGTAGELVGGFGATVEAATASAVEMIEQAASSLSRTFNLFDAKWADHQLDDIRWLRADTFSWQDGTVYSAAYQELWNEMQSSETVSESESVNGITISYLRTPKGYKIVNCTPAAGEERVAVVASVYEATGVAWYYIIDGANKRFKLPRTKYGFTGFRDSVGGYVPESLPNITGTSNGYCTAQTEDGSNVSGCIYNIPTKTGQGANSNTSWNSKFGFDASLSSPTYQDGAAVQQRGTQMYLYFYVGNYTQPAIEQTAGLNAELFNGKLDIADFAAVLAGNNGYTTISIVNDGATYGTVCYEIFSNAAKTNRTLCLQCGYVKPAYQDGATPISITYLKPFSTIFYAGRMAVSSYAGAISTGNMWASVSGVASTFVRLARDNNTQVTNYWLAIGK